ncbi:MAG: histidine phosphatase family protein [Chloroflexi bacterium]|nr:histidine phosphatase family protein [Chloroflexota bacterium]
MRYVEVRRHTLRQRPGEHVTQAGVELARRVGNRMGPFARVVTSKAPRAFETAIAMGFAVDEQDERLSKMGEDVDAEITWPASFAEYARVIRQGGATARFARAQAEVWRSLARELRDGEQALVVTHGGIVEIGAIGCLPNADHAAWGNFCDLCEGVRLSFDGKDFVEQEIMRVDPKG